MRVRGLAIAPCLARGVKERRAHALVALRKAGGGMELRQAGHTQLLANFARFFKAKKEQGSYEVRAVGASVAC